jgi:hypothetical protein
MSDVGLLVLVAVCLLLGWMRQRKWMRIWGHPRAPSVAECYAVWRTEHNSAEALRRGLLTVECEACGRDRVRMHKCLGLN